MESAIFMIKGGRALEMVKEHIAERQRVTEDVHTLMEELGVERVSISRTNGVLMGVVFENGVHPEFCKPQGRDNVSRPKKGTEWAQRFKAQKGYTELAGWIAKEFSIPCTISYYGDDCHGSRHIGSIFNECGFLYLGADGPYAMYCPDVPAEVAATIKEGYAVEEPAKSFHLHFDGCRRIAKEEWEIMVLQHKLAQKEAHHA